MRHVRFNGFLHRTQQQETSDRFRIIPTIPYVLPKVNGDVPDTDSLILSA